MSVIRDGRSKTLDRYLATRFCHLMAALFSGRLCIGAADLLSGGASRCPLCRTASCRAAISSLERCSWFVLTRLPFGRFGTSKRRFPWRLLAAIDPLREPLITFLPGGGAPFPGRPHISAMYPWTTHGVRGVKLEWVQAGIYWRDFARSSRTVYSRDDTICHGQIIDGPTSSKIERLCRQTSRASA